jgi:hypothetical protein
VDRGEELLRAGPGLASQASIRPLTFLAGNRRVEFPVRKVEEATVAQPVNPADASHALEEIDRRRRQVIAEIDVPAWYWWFLAAGWVALGLVTIAGNPWLSVAATVGFGAVHSTVAARAIDGRHGSRQLRPRADVVSRHVQWFVIGFLLVLVAITVGIALVADGLGSPQPALIASVAVAIVVLVGGPRVMALVRHRAERSERP